MVGEPLQIDTVGSGADQLGLAVAGTAADQHYRALDQLFGELDSGLAQRLIAADDQRVLDAGLM